MGNKIVWIKCKQVCEYSQQHTITDEEYEILKNVLDEDDCIYESHHVRNSPYSIMEGYVDSTDILDTEREYTDVSVELYKPEKKKITKK